MMAQKVVLVVDDTPQNIQMIAAVLKDSYRVKVATSGEKALVLAHAADGRPDLILLDVMMPGMDGYQVCERLKSDPATQDIPVIFLTARTEVDDETKGFEVGAVDYIHKPFSPPIVRARVRTQMALRDALFEAECARREASELLEVILPKAAANEIRQTGTVIPRRHDPVAVLFCDVVNFTAYCDHHQPEDVVSRLDALFVRFEEIVRRHGLEKIKTVGDSVMVAGNLLCAKDDAVAAAARCGLDMASELAAMDFGWTARVGLHVGPVVAGIVGQERYQFDIWGDTVNVAARVCGLGVPGTVVVTDEAWRRLDGRFTGASLGRHAVKGKGEIEVFEVTGADPRAATS